MVGEPAQGLGEQYHTPHNNGWTAGSTFYKVGKLSAARGVLLLVQAGDFSTACSG